MDVAAFCLSSQLFGGMTSPAFGEPPNAQHKNADNGCRSLTLPRGSRNGIYSEPRRTERFRSQAATSPAPWLRLAA